MSETKLFYDSMRKKLDLMEQNYSLMKRAEEDVLKLAADWGLDGLLLSWCYLESTESLSLSVWSIFGKVDYYKMLEGDKNHCHYVQDLKEATRVIKRDYGKHVSYELELSAEVPKEVISLLAEQGAIGTEYIEARTREYVQCPTEPTDSPETTEPLPPLEQRDPGDEQPELQATGGDQESSQTNP